MSRQIPEPIRAYVGLAATVLDEARKIPGALPGLPVRVVGLAMQTALKVQQQWAGLVARGDEVLTGFRGEDEPGLATFDDDDLAQDTPAAPSARASAFDRAAADVPDHDDPAVEDTAAALDETDAVVAPLVDDEISGLAAASDPDEVVETLQDITDQVAALDVETALEDASSVLTPEDALETALLETDGADDTPAAEDDTTGVEITEVDILTPDGEVQTVEATITDEAIAAPETLADLEPADPGAAPVTEADADGAAQGTADLSTTGADSTADATESTGGADATDDTGADAAADDAATAVDEGGTPVAAATGVRTDVGGTDTAEDTAAIAEGAAVGAVGATADQPDAAPTDDPQGGSELSGSQTVGTAPIAGYDSWTVAQLRGRLRGYQLSTVSDLLAYEESSRNREQFVRMLRNRLEKLERQAVESSPFAPRGL